MVEVPAPKEEEEEWNWWEQKEGGREEEEEKRREKMKWGHTTNNMDATRWAVQKRRKEEEFPCNERETLWLKKKKTVSDTHTTHLVKKVEQSSRFSLLHIRYFLETNCNLSRDKKMGGQR